MKKKIGYLEKVLIDECRKETPSLIQINRLFELGADPNAVNEEGESVLSVVFDGYCGGVRGTVNAAFAPQITVVFLCNGFDVRKHGLKAISSMQNSMFTQMKNQLRISLEFNFAVSVVRNFSITASSVANVGLK